MVKRREMCAIVLAVLMLFSAQCFAKVDINRSYTLEQSMSKPKMKALKQEVLKSFTLYGQPISPRAIREFITWPSDLLSPIVAIDLNATVDL